MKNQKRQLITKAARKSNPTFIPIKKRVTCNHSTSNSERYYPNSPAESPVYPSASSTISECSTHCSPGSASNSHARYNRPTETETEAPIRKKQSDIPRQYRVFPAFQKVDKEGYIIPLKGKAVSKTVVEVHSDSEEEGEIRKPPAKKPRPDTPRPETPDQEGQVNLSIAVQEEEEVEEEESFAELAYFSETKTCHPLKLTQLQRQQALEVGYLTNLSVSPSVQQAAQGLESIKLARNLNSRTRSLLQVLTVQSSERDNHLNQVEHSLNLYLEERKAQVLAKYSDLFENPTLLTSQISSVTQCFDKKGTPILYSAEILVDCPFSSEPVPAQIVQLLEDNIVLARIKETGIVAGFQGFQVVVKSISV